MISYSIRNWEENYESAETRRTTHLSWIKVPNAHDSLAIKTMMQEEEWPAIFGVWNLLLQIASRGKPGCRGLLERDGVPLTEKQLSILTGVKMDVLSRAIKVLSSDEIGWINAQGTTCDKTGRAQGTPRAYPGNEQGLPRTDKIREEKIREEKIKDMTDLLPQTASSDIYEFSIPEKKKKKPKLDPEFCEVLWKIYPRKEGKIRAMACVKRHLESGETEENLFRATRRFASFCHKENVELQFIPHGSTFFSSQYVDWINQNPRLEQIRSPREIIEEHNRQVELENGR